MAARGMSARCSGAAASRLRRGRDIDARRNGSSGADRIASENSQAGSRGRAGRTVRIAAREGRPLSFRARTNVHARQHCSTADRRSEQRDERCRPEATLPLRGASRQFRGEAPRRIPSSQAGDEGIMIELRVWGEGDEWTAQVLPDAPRVTAHRSDLALLKAITGAKHALGGVMECQRCGHRWRPRPGKRACASDEVPALQDAAEVGRAGRDRAA